MTSCYENGKYLSANPDWHAEDSLWKAERILEMMERNHITPSTIADVGCGAGEVLLQLYETLPSDVKFHGYDISSQALTFCHNKSRKRLNFSLLDAFYQTEQVFDLVMCIDVFEHIEDSYGFLRNIKEKGVYKIFHIPLDISVQMLLRTNGLERQREQYGHLHFYTKETALRILTDTGYLVKDWCFTPIFEAGGRKNVKSRLLTYPRKILFALNQELPARIFGGYSLLVLAR